MFPLPLPLLKFWREGVILGLGLVIAWLLVSVANQKAAHEKTKADNRAVLQDLANKTLAAYQAVMADDAARKKANADLDLKHTKELDDEKAKLARLQSDVAAGRVGLRINATCKPSAGADVPAPTGTASVADAEGPRLAESAERDYFALRAGIETSRKQIEGLQDYVNNVCLR